MKFYSYHTHAFATANEIRAVEEEHAVDNEVRLPMLLRVDREDLEP